MATSHSTAESPQQAQLCAVCLQEFTAKSGRSQGGRPALYCSKKCANYANRHGLTAKPSQRRTASRKTTRKKNLTNPKKTYRPDGQLEPCIHCGDPFEPSSGQERGGRPARYCSPRCRTAAHRKRTTPQKPENGARRTDD